MADSFRDDAWNMTLLAHHTLDGFGGIGEGMAIQEARDGRRILWLAHEGPPKNFTGGWTSAIRAGPRGDRADGICAHRNVRSNSLDLSGELMAVAYQTMGPRGLLDPGARHEARGGWSSSM